MSGDCGHGWGYHFQGSSGPCFRCMGYHSMGDAVGDVVALRAKLRDCEARLRAVRVLTAPLSSLSPERHHGIERVTDLRVRNWRKS